MPEPVQGLAKTAHAPLPEALTERAGNMPPMPAVSVLSDPRGRKLSFDVRT